MHAGPNGLELAKAMRQKNPKQDVAMFTGGMPVSAVRSCGRLKIPVLWKPCDEQALLRLLKAVMAIKKKRVGKKIVHRQNLLLARRDDNGAETSTRPAKKGNARSRRNLGTVHALLENLMANGWKTKSQ